MLEINETIIKNKGLDYLRQLDSFFIWGNHYFPYPNELRELKDVFDVNIEYFGPTEQGSAKSTFIKKPSEQVIKENLQKEIDEFAKSKGIIIKSWEYAF